MLLILTFLALGYALSFVLPGGVEPGTKYEAPTEASFQALLKRRGLSE